MQLGNMPRSNLSREEIKELSDTFLYYLTGYSNTNHPNPAVRNFQFNETNNEFSFEVNSRFEETMKKKFSFVSVADQIQDNTAQKRTGPQPGITPIPIPTTQYKTIRIPAHQLAMIVKLWAGDRKDPMVSWQRYQLGIIYAYNPDTNEFDLKDYMHFDYDDQYSRPYEEPATRNLTITEWFKFKHGIPYFDNASCKVSSPLPRHFICTLSPTLHNTQQILKNLKANFDKNKYTIQIQSGKTIITIDMQHLNDAHEDWVSELDQALELESGEYLEFGEAVPLQKKQDLHVYFTPAGTHSHQQKTFVQTIRTAQTKDPKTMHLFITEQPPQQLGFSPENLDSSPMVRSLKQDRSWIKKLCEPPTSISASNAASKSVDRSETFHSEDFSSNADLRLVVETLGGVKNLMLRCENLGHRPMEINSETKDVQYYGISIQYPTYCLDDQTGQHAQQRLGGETITNDEMKAFIESGKNAKEIVQRGLSLDQYVELKFKSLKQADRERALSHEGIMPFNGVFRGANMDAPIIPSTLVTFAVAGPCTSRETGEKMIEAFIKSESMTGCMAHRHDPSPHLSTSPLPTTSMSPIKSDNFGGEKVAQPSKTQKLSNMGAPNAKETQLSEMNEKIIHTLLALIQEPVPDQQAATWRDQNILVSKPSTGEISVRLDLSAEQWEMFRKKCIEKLEKLDLKPSDAEVRIEPYDGKHRMLIDSKALLQTHEHSDTEQKSAPRKRGGSA